MVEDYKYLGNNRLSWKTNTEVVYKKRMSKLHFLWRPFNICSRILEIIYQSVVASTQYSVVCYGSSVGTCSTNRLNKLTKAASSVIGCKPDTFEVVVEGRTLSNPLFRALFLTD